MSLLATVTRTIDKYRLLEKGDNVLVALSGGPDSVALLHLLFQLKSHYELQLTAVYVNHGIRPRAAAKEEKFCEALCAELEISCIVVRESIPALAKQRRIGLEEAGRAFRYNLFGRLAKSHGFDKVALGHHVDDRVETVLFRIFRGTGPTGLAGIPVKRGIYVRPLFEITKSQILAYLKERRLRFCIDRSNERSEYTRNYIRNKLLPEVRQRLNPQVDRAILNLSEAASAEERVFQAQVEKAARQSVAVTPGGKIELDRRRFAGYTSWLRRRLLRYCLGSISEGQMVDRETVDRLENQILQESGSLSLPGRIQAVMTDDKFVFAQGQPIYLERELASGKSVELEPVAARIRMHESVRRSSAVSKKRQATRVSFDAQKVEYPLTVRTIRAGDRFQPLGMKGTKKVGDFLTDRKVPKVYRDEILVVTDGRGIIWVVGYEITDRVKVDKTTRKVVTLEVNNAKRTLAPAV